MISKKWSRQEMKSLYPGLDEDFTGGVLDNQNRNWFFKSYYSND